MSQNKDPSSSQLKNMIVPYLTIRNGQVHATELAYEDKFFIACDTTFTPITQCKTLWRDRAKVTKANRSITVCHDCLDAINEDLTYEEDWIIDFEPKEDEKTLGE